MWQFYKTILTCANASAGQIEILAQPNSISSTSAPKLWFKRCFDCMSCRIEWINCDKKRFSKSILMQSRWFRNTLHQSELYSASFLLLTAESIPRQSSSGFGGAGITRTILNRIHHKSCHKSSRTTSMDRNNIGNHWQRAARPTQIHWKEGIDWRRFSVKNAHIHTHFLCMGKYYWIHSCSPETYCNDNVTTGSSNSEQYEWY